jgi:hypothetical protein
MISGEFRRGNLSGLLRDNSGSQFKSISRGLDRGNSAAQSKENLVDISSTSNDIFFSKGLKSSSSRTNNIKSSRDGPMVLSAI